MVTEKWKDVVGYEGYYQVSDLGRIRSVDRVVPHILHSTYKLRGKILRSGLTTEYKRHIVSLCKNGIKQTVYVHQLVAAAWIGPCPNGYEVRHGPMGNLDNSVSNLCYGTKSENALDRRRDGTHGGRPVRRSDGVEYINMRVAAEETCCKRQGIWKVCNGKRKITGGYGWEYITEKQNV